MSKDPAFLFYSSDFDQGTKFFTDEQVGKYIRLLIAQHQHGHLTKDQMMFICKSYDEHIFQKFTIDDNGLYYQKRLQLEAEKRQNYTKSRGENRLKGAVKDLISKGKKHKKIISKSYDIHMENENDNEDVNKNAVENLYSLYPSKCPYREKSTGKCSANKTKIEGLLKKYTEDQLRQIIVGYLKDCEKSKTYLKNFTTFLNQLPVDFIEQHKEQPIVQDTRTLEQRVKDLYGEI